MVWNHPPNFNITFMGKSVSTDVAVVGTTYDVISGSDYILIFLVLPYVGLIVVATYNALNDLYISPNIVLEIK